MKLKTESDLKELARSKIIQSRVGLLSADALVLWADDQIRRLSEPPYYLIAMSVGDEEGLRFVDRLDLVLARPNDNDAKRLARRILELLEEGVLCLDSLEELFLQCSSVLTGDGEYRWQFDAMADDLYLAREGGLDQADSQANVIAVLKGMAQ